MAREHAMASDLRFSPLDGVLDALLEGRTLFFCSGSPKSGTTLLQRALDLHPQVSCPTEHEFQFFVQHYEDVLTRYNEVLAAVDARTGGQGPTLVDNRTAFRILKFTVLAIIIAAAGRKPIVGAKDNTVIVNLSYYDGLFRGAKFVLIFRHPLDQAVSSWHHNLRVERDFRQRAQGLAEWVLHVGASWRDSVRMARDFARDHPNVFTLRYEDLVREKSSTLSAVFRFLGAECDKPILERISAETDFEAMKKASPAPAFFRAAATDQGGDAVAEELKGRVREICAEELAFMGY